MTSSEIKSIWGRIAWLGKELQTNEIAAATVAKEVTVAAFKLAAASPKQLGDCKIHIAKLLGVANLDQWIEETIIRHEEDPHFQYRIAQGYGAACIFGGDYTAALRIWGLGLIKSRQREKTQLEAIDATAAQGYDSSLLHQRACRDFMAFLRPHLYHRNDFLDLCCGTGLTTEHLGLVDRRVTGVDLELDGLRVSGRASLFSALHQGDAQAILPSLPAASFDAIWCCGAAYFFSDLSWIFSEAFRLLRPGGILSMNVWPSLENMDVSVTKGGTFRYCHSNGYLLRCAEAAGMRLAETRWALTYNMPTWCMIFEKQSG